MTGSIKSWIKVFRLQTALVTALALWVGYVSTGQFELGDIVVLAIVGLLTHMWGFGLNEVYDYEYDVQNQKSSGHPIATGKVERVRVKYASRASMVFAIFIIWMGSDGVLPPLMLGLSVIPGFAYNKYSKVHWWSNIYLSIWAFILVMAGALYVGEPNITTYLIAGALFIQIFVQVIEGDIKDIEGPESTFAGRFGTHVFNSFDVELNNYKRVKYSNTLLSTVFTLKFIEAGLITMVGFLSVKYGSFEMFAYVGVMCIALLLFIHTLSNIFKKEYDRDRVKINSAKHELTSIAVIGISVSMVNFVAGMIVLVAPIVWFIGINAFIHSKSLSPDI